MIPNKKYLDYEGLKYYHIKLIKSISDRIENLQEVINGRILELENRLNNSSEVQLNGGIHTDNIKISIDSVDPVNVYSDVQTNFAIDQAVTQTKEDIYENVDGIYYRE